MIDSTSFGRISINGRTYDSDLMIFPNGRIRDDWWRKKGHTLQAADVDELLSTSPAVLVVGMGVNGFMKPDEKLKTHLRESGVELIADKNPAAAKAYNQNIEKGRPTAACFHLTC